MAQIIENVTLSDIELNDLGILVPAGGTYDLADKYSVFVEQSVDLETFILSGDLLLQINDTDPQRYYSAQQALRVVKREITTVVAGGDAGDVLVTDNGEISWNASATVNNQLYHFVFMDEDKAKNKWLSFYGDGDAPSDETPAIIAWDSRIAALTFTNKKDGADCDIEIYKLPYGETNTNNAVKIYTWSLTNVRTATQSDFGTTIQLNAGDKIGIFCRDTGSDAYQVVLNLYLQVVNDTGTNTSENFGGYLGL